MSSWFFNGEKEEERKTFIVLRFYRSCSSQANVFVSKPPPLRRRRSHFEGGVGGEVGGSEEEGGHLRLLPLQFVGGVGVVEVGHRVALPRELGASATPACHQQPVRSGQVRSGQVRLSLLSLSLSTSD